MADLAPIPDWVRLGHRAIVIYGAVCLVAGCVALFWYAGFLGLLMAPFLVMTPEIVLAWLAGPIAFGLGHWIGDLVSKHQAGHTVARMLSRNAQSVHGTAIVLGTCSYFPLIVSAGQEGVSVRTAWTLGLVLLAVVLSASAHTARHRGRPFVAAVFSATTYTALGVLIAVFGRAMWLGTFALPFIVYFAATAWWLMRGPQWHDG
jgi:hypothetical protein